MFIHPPLIRTFGFLIPFGYCKKCCYDYSCIKFLFEQLFSVLLGVYLKVELLDHMVISLVAQRLKPLPQCGRPGFDPWVGKILWRRKWQPTPVFLPGESHGQRSLVGYSRWGRKESDMTERLHSLTYGNFTFNLFRDHQTVFLMGYIVLHLCLIL